MLERYGAKPIVRISAALICAIPIRASRTKWSRMQNKASHAEDCIAGDVVITIPSLLVAVDRARAVTLCTVAPGRAQLGLPRFNTETLHADLSRLCRYRTIAALPRFVGL